jgi:GT2 family glycosyltransferase
MKDPFVTIIVLCWNSLADIADCLNSINNQTYTNFKIVIIDNCSTDGTVKYIQENYPHIKVIKLSKNYGYRRGNSIGMKSVKGDFLVICNDDIRVQMNWLDEMVRAMHDDVGLVTPLILFDQDPEIVNAAGNTLHYSGMCGPRGKNDLREMHEAPITVSAVSGCCFMVRRELLHSLGYFSTDFDRLDVGWHASFEEVDLGWRAMLRGYRIQYAPKSVMYHKYKQPEMFHSRFGAYEWGRYLIILRNYSIFSLLMLFPLLVFQEICAWGYALSKGKAHFSAKLNVMKWLVTHPQGILTMRESIQKTRLVSDYDVVRQLDSMLSLSGDGKRGKLSLAINYFFKTVSFAYFQIFIGFLRVESFLNSNKNY